jgi:hypothetical protein
MTKNPFSTAIQIVERNFKKTNNSPLDLRPRGL